MEYSVRESMCKQLRALCRCVTNDQIRDVILPEVIELMKDEKHQVRDAALQALANIVNVVTPEVVKSTILPAVHALAEAAAKTQGTVHENQFRIHGSALGSDRFEI
jgi:hypothetical protein